MASTARARELYDQALRVRVEIGDEAGISVTTFNLGLLAMDDGDYENARLLFERSHDIDASLDDEWGAMIGSLGIAAAAVALADLEAASPRLAEAVRYFLDAEDEDHLAEALSVCAEEACARQSFERAARLLGAVEGLWERARLPPLSGGRGIRREVPVYRACRARRRGIRARTC